MAQENIRVFICDSETCDNRVEIESGFSAEPGWVRITIDEENRRSVNKDFCSAKCAVGFLMSLDDDQEVIKTVIVDEENK